MYLFRIFRSFLPLHNPIGFGASDLLILATAILLAALLIAKACLAPYLPQITERPLSGMGLLFALTIGMRLTLLPQSPIPIPSGADDFSYLLLGDTIAHLRLANPEHPLHQFFESVFTLHQPSYASIYPLGQGIVLALGQTLLRAPWAGVLLLSGAFTALCFWMLRAWVAPEWAFAGGLLAVIQFGPLNPWVNSYWGGLLSACAGCLVFGALPRLRESPNTRYGALLGTGLAIQILTRPFESIFLVIAVAVYLLVSFRATVPSLRKPAFAAAGIVAAALSLTLLQNKAVTKTWTTLPYALSRYQYGVPTTFTFQPNPVPHRQLTAEQQLDYQAQSAIHGTGTDTGSAYFQRLAERLRYLRFFLLPPLYLALLFFVPSLRQWHYLWAAATVVLFVLGTNFYPYFFPQYIAAVTCLFVLFSVLGLQRLGTLAGPYLWLPCAAFFLFWFGIYAGDDDAMIRLNGYQSWYYINRGDPQGRAAIQKQLEQSPGPQLVFVRYSPFHRFEEWIHNAADIDGAQIVWAGDLGTEENQKLLQYYPRRNAWLLQPDMHPPALTPYPRESGPFLTVQ